MEQALNVQHLSKRYGKVPAIRDVNLTIEKGGITALVGPNGAGKTTILNVISGLEIPDEGAIYLAGMLVTNPSQLRRACTLVFQKATVFTGTVFDNVAYGLSIRGAGKSEIHSRVDEALTLTKLKPYAYSRARSLSGGETQRLSIARALALLPEVEVLMLDEPNANLDRESVAILEAVLRHLANEHVTMVMTTHQLDRLIGFVDKVALVKDGTIQAVGEPEDILSNFSPMQMENYIRGVAEPTEYGTSIVSAEAIKVEVSGKISGPVTLRIDPRSILVSKELIQSSARNVFKGTIEQATVIGDLVQLKLNVGRPFIVHLTRSSYAGMKLNIGEKVCIAFKATSIDMI
jgi:molybdopterin-binding protein